MKNTVKIITLVLSCLLLIGTVIGISAFAEENATVSIKAKNIAYEGAIKVLYAVDAKNVPEDAEVKMYFFDEMYGEVIYEKSAHTEDITIGGETYKTFFTNGIAPKNMRSTIYAKAVIVSGDGTVLAESDYSEYSIWQYAINRFEKAPAEDQLRLYTEMLNYGAAVQNMLVKTNQLTEAEVIADGGWANEYCGIKTDTYRYDDLVSEGNVQYYAPDTNLTLTTDRAAVSGAWLYNFTDKDGEVIGQYGSTYTTSVPGVTTIKANYYMADVAVVDYETDGLDVDVNTTYGKTTINNVLGFRNEYFGTSKTGTLSSAILSDNGNEYLYAESNGTKGGLSTQFLHSSAKNAAGYNKFFVETDLRWDGFGDDGKEADAVYFRIYTASTADQNGIVNITIRDGKPGSDTYTLGIYGTGESNYITLKKGEWVNLKVIATSREDGKFDAELYINSELAQTHIVTPTVKDGKTINRGYFYGAYFFTRSNANNSAYYSFAMDNTIYGMMRDDYDGGAGKYFNDSTALGTKEDFATTTPAEIIKLNGNVAPSSRFSIKDNALSHAFGKDGDYFGVKNTASSTGNVHIAEFDFNMLRATSTSSSNYFGWWGLAESGGVDQTKHFLTMRVYVNSIDEENNVLTYKLCLNYSDTDAVTIGVFDVDTWYNFRFEYTANNTTDADGNTVYDGTLNFYVNNILKFSTPAHGYKDSDAEPNTSFDCFYFNWRNSSNSKISNVAALYDNFYFETKDTTK